MVLDVTGYSGNYFGVHIASRLWRRSAQKKFADNSLIKRLSPNQSIFKSHIKSTSLCLELLAVYRLALVNPKIGTKARNCSKSRSGYCFCCRCF